YKIYEAVYNSNLSTEKESIYDFIQIGNNSDGRYFVDMSASESISNISNFIPIDEIKTEPTQTTPTQLSTQPSEVQEEVEISSNAKGLAAALTNPTELAKSKGNLTQSYPVEFRGNTYKDAEAAYQALKSTATKDEGPNSTYNLMVDIIKAKLQQHPRLVSEITKQGGSAWILSSTHQPTKQNNVWETGGKNWFIKALNDAYLSTQPSTSVEGAEVAPERTEQFSEFGTDYRFNIKNNVVTSGEFRQKGRDWQPMNSKNVVSKYTSLSQKPKQEVPSVEPGAPTLTIFEARNVQIDYTAGQTKALSDVQNLINANKQGYYLLAGYAGTGKTTIAENIARYARLKGRPAIVLAPTNKAAKVLNDKLKAAGVSSEATTIHKAIYGEPNPLTGEWVIGAAIKNSVLIIDESSMISKELMNDLIGATNKNNILIFMGDSFQLEPVGEDSGLFKGKVTEVKNSQTELTEVKRQSLDSNVLKVATLTRIEGKPYIPAISIQDFKVAKSKSEFIDDFKSAIKNGEDVVMIVATNNERIAMNNVARQVKFEAQKTILNE
ncbi:MAG: hypothetical protein EBU90_28890, partial [Proteobacteria bacterium]|nr:hypothetical protein [Pseudomonadota bacterium]